MKEETTDSLGAGAVGALPEVLIPQSRRRNGDMRTGYSRQAALRRKQCDTTT
jgi:hypothetical protein